MSKLIEELARSICESCPSREYAACVRPCQASDIAIVVDFPTQLESRRGRLLDGDTGRLIKAILKSNGVDIRDVYVTSALNCRPTGQKESIMRPAMQECRRRLVDELLMARAKKVLCLGPIGYAAIMSQERIPRVVKYRGRWKQAYGMNVLGTYSPISVFVDPELFRDLSRDFEKFLTTNGREMLPDIDVFIAYDYDDARHVFSELKRAQFVSADFETTGFSPIDDEPLALGYCIVDEHQPLVGHGYVLSEDALADSQTWKLIAHQLNSDQGTVFHNAKFDLKFMRRNIERHGYTYDPWNLHCTMVLNYLLDERPLGKYGAHSLEGIARVRYDAPDYGIDMGKWLKALPTLQTDDEIIASFDHMYRYCAVDCYYTARLFTDLLAEVSNESPGLLDAYDMVLMPATQALADVELRGIKLDVSKLKHLQLELTKRERRLLREIRAHVAEWMDADEFNPNSTKQLKHFVYDVLKMPLLRTERRGRLQEGPTSSAVFKMLMAKYPDHKQFFLNVIEYRTARKTIGTYIKGILERMNSDGRIRTDLLTNGTVTGRLSSRNPNLQNIPEVSHVKIDIRECFIPTDDDWLLIEGDYSQLELRVAAHLSNDQAWIQVYLEDRDLHQDVAGALYKRPREQITPYQRWLAKCTVFGAMYGRSIKSIAFGPEMDYIENEMGGVRWTLEQAQEYYDNFFAKYHGFKKWMDNQHRVVYERHYIDTPFGRRRRFPFIPRNDNGLIKRQAVNNPIQSTASDITLTALVRIHNRLEQLNAEVGQVVAHVVLTIHDSVMVECRKKYRRRVESIMRYEMQDNIALESPVSFKADIHVASTWSGLK